MTPPTGTTVDSAARVVVAAGPERDALDGATVLPLLADGRSR